MAGLPGLAALIALIPTYLSLRATNVQLQIAEQGQITDRYNAAITNLGSSSIEIRLGGIYALQRLMHDSPPDQPTIVAVLCAFVRDRTLAKHIGPGSTEGTPTIPVPADLQAALTVVATRNPADDGRTTVINLSGTELSAASFVDANLARANLAFADLTGTYFTGANLAHANLDGANLTSADLVGADLVGANLTAANLADADLAGALWPARVPAPPGWIYSKGRLTRARIAPR